MLDAPRHVTERLYAVGSLVADATGFRFTLENRLSDATLTRILGLRVDDAEVPLHALRLERDDGHGVAAADVTPDAPATLAVRERAHVRATGFALDAGAHDIVIAVEAAPFGPVRLRTRDHVGEPPAAPAPPPAPRTSAVAAVAATDAPHARHLPPIPYRKDQQLDHAPPALAERQAYLQRVLGVRTPHLARHALDLPGTVGNIERLVGAAQIPLGLAGPLRVRGEHADGEFVVPLATTEGTLVASYSRGMKALNAAGGVTCTVSADCMQRAPVFAFASAREARDFVRWVEAHAPEIRAAAEGTSRVARLLFVEPYLAHRFAFLRFDFATGDAAGQNMVSKATYAACEWILAHATGIRRWYLESNLATDKKVSHVNFLRTRGKRVTAEVTMPGAVLRDVLHVEPEQLHAHAQVANVGAFLAGSSNNGLHAANALTAMFIACGQDVANVAEGSAAVVYTELVEPDALYIAITIPSLIVATYGGGTGLATQRECLEILGCYGPGKVNKLAEIVAGVVLAGELSLAAAISSLEWVPAHERLGRNR